MANFIGVKFVEKNDNFLNEFIKGKEMALGDVARPAAPATAIASEDEAKAAIEAYFSIAEEEVVRLKK